MGRGHGWMDGLEEIAGMYSGADATAPQTILHLQISFTHNRSFVAEI